MGNSFDRNGIAFTAAEVRALRAVREVMAARSGNDDWSRVSLADLALWAPIGELWDHDTDKMIPGGAELAADAMEADSLQPEHVAPELSNDE